MSNNYAKELADLEDECGCGVICNRPTIQAPPKEEEPPIKRKPPTQKKP